jgi:hypothetical protein
MTIQDRMKKYAELCGNKVFSNYVDEMYSDLQAAMKALEVARDGLFVARERLLARGHNFGAERIDSALSTIKEIMGEKL